MADQAAAGRIISMDPQGVDNMVYVRDQEVESGCGSGCSSERTPENTLPKTRSPEIAAYDDQNYRRPSTLHIPYRIAVTVDGAYKKFGDLKALDGVNMRVQEGTIYGLLGSSGCGKTTLLSCLVGLRELDTGGILICGKSPGSPGSGVPGRLVGYMPQDIALNGEFTIREVCHFFGRLYGMTKERVDLRVDHLVSLLDLKRSKTAIKNMSGGQKRRASFLVALLHEPEILILDEPTVGVDPVLRSNIWNHLRELVDKCGTTVLITTHYIEEMRQADTVGIMRNGILMTEGSPQQLMDSHNANMLEDVVLHYCLKTEDAFGEALPATVARRRASMVEIEEIRLDNRNPRFKEHGHGNGVPGKYLPNGSHSNGNGPRRPPPVAAPYMDNNDSDGIQTQSFNRIRALTLKNVIVILRSIGFLIFIFICPAVVVSVYCYVIGAAPTELNLGIVMEGGGHCNKVLSDMRYKCRSKGLDCKFANTLKATGAFTLHFYDTSDEAVAEVEKSNIWGFIHLGTNFSQHIFDRTLVLKNTNETIEGAKIRVYLDMSNVNTGQIIQKYIFESFRIFSNALLLGCDVDITGRDLPISIERPIYGDPNNLKFRNYLAPSMTVGFITFLCTLTCGLAYLVEKTDGMIHRTKVAGVTTIEIMISHFVPQFVIMMVQVGCAFAIMFLWFDIPKVGSVCLAYICTLWYGVAAIGLGFMAATVFDDEKNAMLCAVSVMLPNFILSGILFPLETMPPIIRKVAFVIPGTHPSESVRSILLRGWDLSHYAVYLGFIAPLVFILIFALVTAIIIKVRK